jgi:hypothetical protein
MKGISYTIIALIAIIFVPIVLLTSLIVISTTQTDIPAGVEAALEDFSVVYTDGNKVYVRNDGSETLGDLTFSLDGETVIASPALECLGGIKPNKICEYIVNTEDAGELTVSGKGKAVKTLLSIDYIITPTTTTTTIKKIGGHSGDSGDLPSGGGSPTTTTTVPIVQAATCPPIGDVNLDGSVTMDDAIMIGQYDVGLIDFTEDQKLRGDVNGDGIVNTVDSALVGQFINGIKETLPACESSGAYTTVMKGQCPPFGDVNSDGAITIKDANTISQYNAQIIELTDDQKLRADVNNNGEVDINDALFIGQFVYGTRETLPVCESSGTYTQLMLTSCPPIGDVNLDGSISIDDSTLIQNYIAEIEELTDDQKLRADVNNNGEVDINDALFIGQFVYGTRETLPVCA